MPELRNDYVKQLADRLPPGRDLSIPDIAVALNVHRDVVQGWIDLGEVDAVDMGAGGRQQWVISKESLCEFLDRRSVGIRAPADRRLENRQLQLFKEPDRA